LDSPANRLNVTLDAEHAARLARLAERTHVHEGTLARSLLSSATDDADPDHPAAQASVLTCSPALTRALASARTAAMVAFATP
jgi:hypothetical protein